MRGDFCVACYVFMRDDFSDRFVLRQHRLYSFFGKVFINLNNLNLIPYHNDNIL